MADDPNLATVEQPATEQPKPPEIADIDLTAKLLSIAEAAKTDPALAATYSAALAKLAEMNKVIQDQIDKQRAEATKRIAAEEAKAAKEAMQAKRKAEDEAAAKAEEEAAKTKVA